VARFCRALVNQEGVLLLPGNIYGDKGNHFRIGFGRRSMPAALTALDAFIVSSNY
jgi:aspartate/methionine/tyrosine aminotransferase